MATELAIVKEDMTERKTKKRERIQLIETPPKQEWFVKTRERGRIVWYLRLIVTGMFPRRYGPFRNRHKALLALDGMLDAIGDGLSGCDDVADKYRLKRRFQQPWGPVIEDELALPNGGQ